MAPQPNVLAEADGRLLVAGVVHAHTTFSDGRRDLADLVSLVHGRGVGVVVVTDHHDDTWHWGPLVYRRPAVLTDGPEAYQAKVREIAATSPGPMVLVGYEVGPHYRWEGWPPFLRCEVMKTLVLYGVEPATVRTLPTRLDGRGRDETEALEVAQAVLDHVAAAGGLAYWSHLDHDERNRFGPARWHNRPRPELLARTHGYTGFGCFPQGRDACTPGGLWDAQLARAARARACNGPWVVGETDYHLGDEPAPCRNPTDPLTVLLLDRLEPAAVLHALARGHAYAYQGPRFRESMLVRFRLTDAHRAVSATAGEMLHTSGPLEAEVVLQGFPGGRHIRLVHDGVVKADTHQSVLRATLPPPGEEGSVCRVEVEGPDERLCSNPIFIAPA